MSTNSISTNSISTNSISTNSISTNSISTSTFIYYRIKLGYVSLGKRYSFPFTSDATIAITVVGA